MKGNTNYKLEIDKQQPLTSITSLHEPINEPRRRFLGYMPPGSGRCAIAISWIFYIFTPTTNCQLPRTTNCHNAHAQQAPQRARSRSKWRRGGGAPPPAHTEPPMARIPGRGRLSTMGASSPLEYCSLKQEIAKKALFEKENLMRRTASAISYQSGD